MKLLYIIIDMRGFFTLHYFSKFCEVAMNSSSFMKLKLLIFNLIKKDLWKLECKKVYKLHYLLYICMWFLNLNVTVVVCVLLCGC